MMYLLSSFHCLCLWIWNISLIDSLELDRSLQGLSRVVYHVALVQPDPQKGGGTQQEALPSFPPSWCPLPPRNLVPAIPWQGPSQWPKWIWSGLTHLTSVSSANEVSPPPFQRRMLFLKWDWKTLLLRKFYSFLVPFYNIWTVRISIMIYASLNSLPEQII